MKICKTCGIEKEDSEFAIKISHGRPYTKGSCKECCRIERKAYNDRTKEERAVWGKEYYENNKAVIRKKAQGKKYIRNENSRNRRVDPEKREAINAKKREWYQKNKEKCQAASKKYKEENREKVNAHARLEKAVKSGKVKKPEKCQFCRKILPLEGHHPDHEEWDEVIWLCKMCHAAVHRVLRDKERVIREQQTK